MAPARGLHSFLKLKLGYSDGMSCAGDLLLGHGGLGFIESGSCVVCSRISGAMLTKTIFIEYQRFFRDEQGMS